LAGLTIHQDGHLPACQIFVPPSSIPLRRPFQVSNRKFLSGPRLAILVAIVLALAGGAYVFTASNTIASGGTAGEGESPTMTGYTATAVSWTLDTTNPANIQKVSFSLTPVTASTTVYAGSDNSTTITWSSACVQSGLSGNTATETCTFATEPTANATVKLAVSAAN
jgi:hypothetical protein